MDRGLIFISCATVAACGYLAFLWKRSVTAPRPQTSLPLRKGSFKPLVTGQSLSEALLSPDGRWFARSSGGVGIYSTATGKQVFLAPTTGNLVGWKPNSTAFVVQNGGSIIVLNRAVRRLGAPLPRQPWVVTVINFPSDHDRGIAEIPGTQDDSNLSGFRLGNVSFSPDLRYAVKGSWDKGDVVWEVADLATRKISPPVRLGKWLNYSPSFLIPPEIGIAVAPASLAKGGKPLVALVQTTELFNKPHPVPTSTPLPTPTPTYTPLQSQFQLKALKEEEAIQKLVDKVLGVDGAEPEVTDEAEIARITAGVKRRRAALESERGRVIPWLAISNVPYKKPTPTPETLRYFQIECFSLADRKSLWVVPAKTVFVVPRMKFAPDGSALVVWKTASPSLQYRSLISDETGFEFYAALTGRLIRKAALYEAKFDIPDKDQVVFYSNPSRTTGDHSVFGVKDAYHYQIPLPRDKRYSLTKKGTVFRFFDISTGRESNFLQVNEDKFPEQRSDSDLDIGHFSTSRAGQQWLVNAPDLFFLSRRQLGQERAGALPAPTPTARPRMRKSNVKEMPPTR